MISTNIKGDGIAIVEFQLNNQPALVWNTELLQSLNRAIDECIANKSVKGIILKTEDNNTINPVIFATDYPNIVALEDTKSALSYIKPTQTLFNKIETANKPIVALIRETWVNIGLELALACHYRIAVTNSTGAVAIGFPEIQYGLLPGAGGIQRLGRMLGIQAAATLILRGNMIDHETAHKARLYDQIVQSNEAILKASEWINSSPAIQKNWYLKNFQLPGGSVQLANNAQFLTAANAAMRMQTWGNFINKDVCLSTLYEGLQIPFEKALQLDAYAFATSAISREFKSLINTMVVARAKAIQLHRRPANIQTKQFKKIGILGAGMMGSGIAFVSAQAGLDVILIDSKQATADQGKAFTEKQLSKLLERGQINEEAKQIMLGRITATEQYEALADCDLVIETVTENRKIKAEVTKKAEAIVSEDCIIASNTSTLPITGLASAVKNQARFIGIHFFSPVHKMPLIEVILGKKTSDETLAHALDFTRKLTKIPIVVNDGRGFFTTRVFEQYVLEGMALLADGVEPALIENAAKMAGYSVGPLALADEVSIELMKHIATEAKQELGDKYQPSPGEAVVNKLIKLKRTGRKGGGGFYEYPKDGSPKFLWPDLAKHFKPSEEQPSARSIENRLLLIQSLEALHALEEGIIEDQAEADLGSVLGIGFPAFKAGVLGHLKNLGYENALTICKDLAKSAGKRFTPPKTLIEWAK